MKTIKTIILIFLILITCSALYAQSQATIQVAILLDTSNSMDGLIAQAKGNLWKIINQFASAQKKDYTTKLEVALYEYGNNWLTPQSGYIQQVLPFSEDLDALSEELFRLRTNGGDEYCGMVIQQAMAELKWSARPQDMKVIYIAGNESFNQGSVDFTKVCTWAKNKGIRVNTIFCGDYQSGKQGYWQAGAILGGGKYMNINQDMKIKDYNTPYDNKILQLNNKLNDTYIPYGHEGEKLKQRQQAQDSNAMSMNKGILTERAAAKASKQYSNSEWDIIDGLISGSVNLDELEEEALPEEMADMDSEEQKIYIKEKSEERKKIQEEISELTEKRKDHIEKLQKEKSEESSLDEAIIESAVDLGNEMGFIFE